MSGRERHERHERHDPMREDPLRTARGIAWGIVIGGVMWAVLIAGIMIWLAN